MSMFISDAAISLDISTLVARFEEMSFGETLTYAELSELLGKPVYGNLYALRRAREIASKHNGTIIDTIRGQGIQKMHPENLHVLGVRARRQIRHTSRRTNGAITRALANTNSWPEGFPEGLKNKIHNERVILSMLEYAAQDKRVADLASQKGPSTMATAASSLLKSLRS